MSIGLFLTKLSKFNTLLSINLITGHLYILYSYNNPTLRFCKLKHNSVYHRADSVMMVKLIIRTHIMHICNRKFIYGVCFNPDSCTAGPAKVTDFINYSLLFFSFIIIIQCRFYSFFCKYRTMHLVIRKSVKRLSHCLIRELHGL